MATSKKAIGITGAFGYIGKRLLARMARTEAFDRVVCRDILQTPGPLEPPFEFFR